ncbi:hypothetical protein ES703_43159 [subsurface metagenome]
MPKVNTLTLIHSQTSTPLTFVQEQLANITSITLPSFEYEKAINHAGDCIRSRTFETKVVAVYIADFDNFGHWYLTENAFREYYSMQSGRIKNGLLKPIFERAKKKSERTLVVLTADHGKLTRYENRILSMVLPQTDDLDVAATKLENYYVQRNPRFIMAWIPDMELDAVAHDIQSSLTENTDISIFSGQTLKRFFPYESQTRFVNPNLFVLSRFRIQAKGMAHGGAAISEVVVPTISFKCNGG